MKRRHKFNYRWTLKDAVFTKDKGNVFSCFACGGGSSLGYKLAGFDVIGCNEIDKRMMDVYLRNNDPKYYYLEPIQTFKLHKDLPEELYCLDILDGSPPCSTFSVAGDREKSWGKLKKFKEGQAEQILDTLFFDFIDLAKKLRPKVVVAENVKGLLLGNAVDYVRRIYKAFDNVGYYCQHFLLDSSVMGVPQKRERVFFICLRKDLARQFIKRTSLFDKSPMINMYFDEDPIMFREVADYSGREITGIKTLELWNNRMYGDNSLAEANLRVYGKSSFYTQSFVYDDKVCPTLTSKGDCLLHYKLPKFLSVNEIIRASSFPEDYEFNRQSPNYVCGMSVPPVMMAQVASRIWEQWISKIVKS